jgi:activator of the mannose operon (transcriptional antiterminator)
MSFPTIKKFLNEELVLFDIDVKEPESIVALLSNLLKEKGYVNNEYLHDVLEREKMSPTTIGGEISIPHGNPRNVLKEGIALAKLKNPISWNGEFVSFVFMLSFKDSKNEDVKKLFQEISTLSEEIEIIEKWKNGKTKIDFYNQI